MKKITMLISLCSLFMLLLCQTVFASRAIWIDRDSTALMTAHTAVVYPIKGMENVSGMDGYLLEKIKGVKAIESWSMASTLGINTSSTLNAAQRAAEVNGKADIFVVPELTFRDSFSEVSPAKSVWTEFREWEEVSDDHGTHKTYDRRYNDYVWVPETTVTMVSQELAFAVYDKSGKLIMTYTMDWNGTNDREMAEDICRRFVDSLKNSVKWVKKHHKN